MVFLGWVSPGQGRPFVLLIWADPETVYLNIANCKWSAIYGYLPQHMSLKLLVHFFGLLFNKQDWQNLILNPESEPSLALVWGMMLIICSGYTACVGQVLQRAAVWNPRWDRRAHSTPLHLNLRPCYRNPGRERGRNIHTTKVNFRQIQAYTTLGSGFPPPQYFTSFPFTLLQPHQDLVTYAAHHDPQGVIQLLLPKFLFNVHLLN